MFNNIILWYTIDIIIISRRIFMDDLLDSTPDITVDYIESYLTGIRYPVAKEDMLRFARMNRANNQVLSILQNLDDGVYHSFDELDFYLQRIQF